MIAYPRPLPLSTAAAQLLWSGDEAFAAIQGAFLAFVMIPVEERIGEWRFAGAAHDLTAARTAIDVFTLHMGFAEPALVLITEMGTREDVRESWSYKHLPLGEIGPHRVVVLAEGDAPYDDCGLCILEVPALRAFAGRAPETERPEGWPPLGKEQPLGRSPLNLHARCGGLVLTSGYAVEHWSNGDLAVPVVVADQMWRIVVAFDGQWIVLHATLTDIPPDSHAATLLACLRWNADGHLTRIGIVDGRLSLRADVPGLDFRDAGFVRVIREMDASIRQLVARFGFDAPVEG